MARESRVDAASAPYVQQQQASTVNVPDTSHSLLPTTPPPLLTPHSLERVDDFLGVGREGHGGRDERALAGQLGAEELEALGLAPLAKGAQAQVPARAGGEGRGTGQTVEW